MSDRPLFMSEDISTSTPIQTSFPENEATKIDFDSFQVSPEQTVVQHDYQPMRTNQRTVRSLLYMGQLLNLNKPKTSDGDFLVSSLETLTSVMDNVYLITKFGVGRNSKFLAKVGANASKVWFVTLLLSIRSIVKNLLKLYNLKSQVWQEIQMVRSEQYRNHLARLILKRYELKIQDIQSEITSNILELIGSLNDLFFVSIEIFKLKVPRWIEKILGFISAAMMIYRMSKRS